MVCSYSGTATHGTYHAGAQPGVAHRGLTPETRGAFTAHRRQVALSRGLAFCRATVGSVSAERCFSGAHVVSSPGHHVAGTSSPLCLLVDGTKVSATHQLLIVALAYRKRALPLAWSWTPGARGHSDSGQQLELLRYVHDLVPSQATVRLGGDCEFGAVAIMQQLHSWHWGYVLRQKGATLGVCLAHGLAVAAFRHLGPGSRVLLLVSPGHPEAKAPLAYPLAGLLETWRRRPLA
jgi:hypothetical protein